MFYSMDLLSTRKRKGKLAIIWLAATLNEHLFKQTVTLQNIRMIAVDAACQEIMKIVDSRDQNPSGRFSLYLSSQLLYGVTRVFQQQLKLLLKDVESTKKGLLGLQMQDLMRFRSNDALKLLEVSDVPTPTFPRLGEDVHLLPEMQEPELTTLRCVVEDFDADLNFGALTEQEMEQFYGPHSTDLLEDTYARKHLSDPGNIEIPLGTSVPLLGIDDTYTVLTPTKRGRAQQSGTPSKRKRLTYEDDTVTKEAHTAKTADIVTPMEVDLIPKDVLSVHTATVPNVSDLPIPEMSTDVSSQLPRGPVGLTDSLQLESLEMDDRLYGTRRKRGHNRLIIDVRTTLKGSVRANWLSDVKIATVSPTEARVDLHLSRTTIADFLRMPSRMVQNVRWKTHCKQFWHNFYDDVIKKEQQRIMNREYQETRPTEVPRAQDTISHEQETTIGLKGISEHSKKEMTANITDPLKVPEEPLALKDDHRTVEFGDLQDIELPPVSVNIDLTDTSAGARMDEEGNKETVTASAMDITMPDQEQIFLENKQKHQLSKERKDFTSSISRSSASCVNGNAHWTRQDLLAILEVHWKDTDLVNFYDIQPETSDREDAVICFDFILVFVWDEIVILHQEEIYSPLYIQKNQYK